MTRRLLASSACLPAVIWMIRRCMLILNEKLTLCATCLVHQSGWPMLGTNVIWASNAP